MTKPLLVSSPVAGVPGVVADAPSVEEHGAPLVSSSEGHPPDSIITDQSAGLDSHGHTVTVGIKTSSSVAL